MRKARAKTLIPERPITEVELARLRKLEHVEELAAAIAARWRLVGRLSRLEEDVRELLSVIRRGTTRGNDQKKSA